MLGRARGRFFVLSICPSYYCCLLLPATAAGAAFGLWRRAALGMARAHYVSID